MNRVPMLFGYAGVVPFFILMVLSFLFEDAGSLKVLSFLEMSYATMILSFLGGVHWGQGLQRNHIMQLSFAMLPTVTGFMLMILVMIVDPMVPLFLAALMFWVVYQADLRLMPRDHVPETYFGFRRDLTFAAMICLVLSGIGTL